MRKAEVAAAALVEEPVVDRLAALRPVALPVAPRRVEQRVVQRLAPAVQQDRQMPVQPALAQPGSAAYRTDQLMPEV